MMKMNFPRVLFSGLVHYSFYAFMLFSLVVSLLSGFAYVMLLGIIDSSLYRTCILNDSPSENGTAPERNR